MARSAGLGTRKTEYTKGVAHGVEWAMAIIKQTVSPGTVGEAASKSFLREIEQRLAEYMRWRESMHQVDAYYEPIP